METLVAQRGHADFEAYLRTDDGKAASFDELEALARVRLAFGLAMSPASYAALRAEMQRAYS